jgi:hypothetical protein
MAELKGGVIILGCPTVLIGSHGLLQYLSSGLAIHTNLQRQIHRYGHRFALLNQ